MLCVGVMVVMLSYFINEYYVLHTIHIRMRVNVYYVIFVTTDHHQQHYQSVSNIIIGQPLSFPTYISIPPIRNDRR